MDGEFKNVIRSDGRGYYAYLPAIFIHNDPTFEASLKAETAHALPDFNQFYLYRNDAGQTYNKYFPGIAVLQAPFFAGGCIMATISGASVDGYSEPFEFAFLLGSLFYSILGIFLFSAVLKRLFPELDEIIPWLVIAVYFATTLLMYNTYTLGLSHHYSFFLFSWFAWLVLKLKETWSVRHVVLLGLVLGLIALVRPTNILVVLSLPLLLGDLTTLQLFFQTLFARKARLFLIGTASFLAVVLVQFSLWKWQSGHWVVWSYSGEGFNFGHPAFFENLFGFRSGVLVHTPLILISALVSLLWIKTDRFKAAFWWIYLLVNTWVISSWWCWDYETSFGNRPFTEHTIFLMLPLFSLLQAQKPKLSQFRALSVVFVAFALLGAVRYFSYTSDYMIDQRFTASNYFESLAVWNDDNFGRWQYPHSVVPFGECSHENVLRDDHNTVEITPEIQFFGEGLLALNGHDRSHEILYFRVSMEKKCTQPVSGAVLVVHAFTNDQSKSYYRAMPLFNDRLEGVSDWAEISFSGQIPDHFKEFDQVKIYVWNKDQEHFELRNLKISVDQYTS